LYLSILVVGNFLNFWNWSFTKETWNSIVLSHLMKEYQLEWDPLINDSEFATNYHIYCWKHCSIDHDERFKSKDEAFWDEVLVFIIFCYYNCITMNHF
jgi:hypothetical protein